MSINQPAQLLLPALKPVCVCESCKPGKYSPQIDYFERRTWAGDREWVIGAVNYDEDLHFSSYYLRASMQPETEELYPGYTCFLSFYLGFNERYYLLREECIHNAQVFVAKAEENVGWLRSILEETRKHCQILWSLFPESEDLEQFRRLPNEDLLNYYLRLVGVL